MTLFQYIDKEIEKKSTSKSASWKRKHYNALQAVKKYCDNKDIELFGVLLPGWMEGLREYYSNPETFTESTSRQYKDVFKTLYASAISELLLPPIKINDLCSEPWDDREEQEYNTPNLLDQIKILDYKNLEKEQSRLRDIYMISIVTMGSDFQKLLSLSKSALHGASLLIDNLEFQLPTILLDKIKELRNRSESLLNLKAFYKGEAKDPIKAITTRMKLLFHSLNLNLFQNEDTFIDWLILAKDSGVDLKQIKKIVAFKLEDKDSEITSDKEVQVIPSDTPSEDNQQAVVSCNRSKGTKVITLEEITSIASQVTERLEVLTSNWYLVRIFKNHFSGEDLVKKLKKDNIVSFKPSEYYAPVYKIKTIHNGVTKIVNSSDTAKMLFVRTSLKYVQKIDRLEEGGLTVARNIKGGKFAIIPINELQRMREFLENNNDEIFLLQNEDYIGRKVIVTKGPYEGWEGEIVKKSTSAIQHRKKNDSTAENINSDQFKEDYENTIFIVQFLNSLKWAIPVSGLEFRFID